MTERPAAAGAGSSSRRPHHEGAAVEDPAVLRKQIYSQLKRSGVVASLKVSSTSPSAMAGMSVTQGMLLQVAGSSAVTKTCWWHPAIVPFTQGWIL
jgi:hypothetical protein